MQELITLWKTYWITRRIFSGGTRQLQGFLANFALFKTNINFFCNIEFPAADAIRFFLQNTPFLTDQAPVPGKPIKLSLD